MERITFELVYKLYLKRYPGFNFEAYVGLQEFVQPLEGCVMDPREIINHFLDVRVVPVENDQRYKAAVRAIWRLLSTSPDITAWENK